MLLEFVRQFPEVTAIDLEAILTQVRGVMDKASLAVQYVFGFHAARRHHGAARRDPGDAR